MLTIRVIDSSDYESWDRFIKEMDETSFHHQIRWKTFIEKMCGNRLNPIYLAACNNREIEGVLPLFIFKHWFFGKKMISIPFSTNGGCYARSESIEEFLIRKAIDLTSELNLDYLELRQWHENKITELRTDNSYFTLKLKLGKIFDQLQKGFRSTTRRYIRKAHENELELDMFSKDFDAFYKIYSQGQRNLGTPISGYDWLQYLFSSFPEYHQIVQVRHKEKSIAAIMLRIYKNSATYVIGSSLPEYRYLYPNYYLFSEVLKFCMKQGYASFDFGRSIETSGTYFFKIGWGAQPLQSYYKYYLANIKKIPSTSQSSPKRILFSKVWKKLPLPIADSLGPIIRKNYP